MQAISCLAAAFYSILVCAVVRGAWASRAGVLSAVIAVAAAATGASEPDRGGRGEVRGTWLTTTANSAIETPQNTSRTMSRLREIGLNTVYVEVWKNGYTQFPSRVLERTIGVDRRPNLVPQDPADTPEVLRRPARDLLEETLIEAHRNGLNYVAWFEYGFMAAHKSTDNHLRRMKKEWLSLDKDGNEVAPNGFVWMNPLHPEARRFLLDLVLEAVDRYDLDGIQIDDRIVWPYVTMGYDEFTRKAYAAEHNGVEPPLDHKDPGWMRWRADKVNEFSRHFVQEVRKARPGLLVSLSPAVYPWCYEHYCLEWPKWAAWDTPGRERAARAGWDEFIPQCYRMNFDAFEKTWLEQVKWMNELGGGRVSEMLAGVRVVGDGPDSTWEDLRKSIELVRKTGGGGHVLWFSRGVLDLYPEQLKKFYAESEGGAGAPNPRFAGAWRPRSIVFERAASGVGAAEVAAWSAPAPGAGHYRVIARLGERWEEACRLEIHGDRVDVKECRGGTTARLVAGRLQVSCDGAAGVELLVDRRRPR